MIFRRYSPDQIKLSFNGVPVTGFMDGTFLDVERQEANFTMHTGSLGDVTRTRNLNKTGKVTFTLMQHAPINDLLTTFLVQDEAGDHPPGTLQCKDLTNNMRCHAQHAWIEKAPKVERGKESMGIQWIIDCADLEIAPSLT